MLRFLPQFFYTKGKKITLKCGSNPPGYPVPQYKWWKERLIEVIRRAVVSALDERVNNNDVAGRLRNKKKEGYVRGRP